MRERDGTRVRKDRKMKETNGQMQDEDGDERGRPKQEYERGQSGIGTHQGTVKRRFAWDGMRWDGMGPKEQGELEGRVRGPLMRTGGWELN
jgi:hypothetical protein